MVFRAGTRPRVRSRANAVPHAVHTHNVGSGCGDDSLPPASPPARARLVPLLWVPALSSSQRRCDESLWSRSPGLTATGTAGTRAAAGPRTPWSTATAAGARAAGRVGAPSLVWNEVGRDGTADAMLSGRGVTAGGAPRVEGDMNTPGRPTTTPAAAGAGVVTGVTAAAVVAVVVAVAVAAARCASLR